MPQDANFVGAKELFAKELTIMNFTVFTYISRKTCIFGLVFVN